MRKSLILIISSLFLLSGCHLNNSASFDAFTNSLFCQELSSNTLNLHYTLVDAPAYGITDYKVSLGDFSKKARDSNQSQLSETLSKLKKISRSGLCQQQKLDYDVLSDYLKNQLELSRFQLYDEVLAPSNGCHGQLPILLSEYKFHSKSDIEEYFLLLSELDSYYNQLLDFEKDKSSAGFFMSDRYCLQVIKQCKTFISKTDDNILITSFAKRLDDLPGLSSKQKQDLIARNKTLFSNHVIPAYNSLIQGLTSLLASGRNSGGICNFPYGKDYYSLLTRSYTGSDHSVDELFTLIDQQRTADLREAAQLTGVNIEEQIPYHNQNQMVSALQQAITKDFPRICNTSCRLCPVDRSLADSLAPAFYITAPYDKYQNNTIYVNTASEYDDLSLFTTLAHEGYPGHLYQTVMSYNYGLSPVRSILSYDGYTEGWATYVEMQSYYYAGLKKSSATYFQKNQAITLSLYASSDIGIHYYGWDFGQLQAFWKQYGIEDSEALQEIQDCIMTSPANYLKYYVGYLEFLQLKNTAQKKYGDSFDAVRFHKALLQIGPAPFDIINKYFDDYYNKA